MSKPKSAMELWERLSLVRSSYEAVEIIEAWAAEREAGLRAELVNTVEALEGVTSQWRVVEAERDKLRAEVEALRENLKQWTAIKWTHDEGCHPSSGRHTAKCKATKRLLAESRALLAAKGENDGQC